MSADRPLVVIHGWSDTARGMAPLQSTLQELMGDEVRLLTLANYESMDDQIGVDDVVEAMSRAWERAGLPTTPRSVDVVVHSTGGLVIRGWLTQYEPEKVPIHHLVMLAPANFGSPLAHKGHSLIGRVVKGWKSEKTFQTGERILRALELASPFSWRLAEHDCLGPEPYYAPGRVLCSVLVGNTGYDGISAAGNEEGSDGTVRISGANLNCALLDADYATDENTPHYTMKLMNGRAGFGVLDGENHATIAMKHEGPRHPRTKELLKRALEVDDAGFPAWCDELDTLTRETLALRAGDPYRHGFQNTVTLVRDDLGSLVSDYFLEFYLNDDAPDDFAKWFHGEVIRTVHPYQDEKAYRSVLVDCTLLHRELDRIADTMHVSLSAVPEFDRNANVGYSTFKDEDIGSIVIHRDEVTKVFLPNRTLLARITLQRKQADQVFAWAKP